MTMKEMTPDEAERVGLRIVGWLTMLSEGAGATVEAEVGALPEADAKVTLANIVGQLYGANIFRASVFGIPVSAVLQVQATTVLRVVAQERAKGATS